MKKVLIITYYWVPAGGPGVQRWIKFAKYLRNFGIEPIIYAPENPHYPMVDENIGEDLPNDLTVIKQPIWEPYRLASLLSKKKTKQISAGILPSTSKSWIDKLLIWGRGNLFIPDARKFWIQPSVKFLQKYIVEHQINTVITTAPPHSLHLIGLKLKEKLGVRWIADFRDPWTNIGYHSELMLTKASAKKHILLEQDVLQKADTIIVTSPTTGKEFKQKTPNPIAVITNGYDDEPIHSTKLSAKFTLAHIGSLLTDRNPKLLWKVLGDLVTNYPEFSKDLHISLAGKVSGEVFDDLKNNGLLSHLTYHGYVSHQKAIELQRKAQLLLLLEIDHPKTQGIIPGKLFEYMATGRPILGIGHIDWDVSQILKQTKSGVALSAKDSEGKLMRILLSYYGQFKEGKLSVDTQNLIDYHRKTLTKHLSEVINNTYNHYLP